MSDSAPLVLTDDALEQEARRLLAAATASPGRFILGIAGIAGSGKSTLAQKVTALLNDPAPGSGGPDTAVFIPMDGFHLPNQVLIDRGWKSCKGAAHTYDARAYIDLLARYADPHQAGGFPVYCREVHEPIPGPGMVNDKTKIVVTEGQYLLLAEDPWNELADILTESWWLDVPAEKARAWLMKRDTSVGRTVAEAEAKYQNNDRLNTEHVLTERRKPDRVARWLE